jgi:hypothetical protein
MSIDGTPDMVQHAVMTRAEEVRLLRQARCLNRRVDEVMARHPEADRDNVRHTLILLRMSPLERLNRALLRGGGQRYAGRKGTKIPA